MSDERKDSMTLTIKEHCWYVRADGSLHGPAEPIVSKFYPWHLSGNTYTPEGYIWDGERISMADLIREATQADFIKAGLPVPERYREPENMRTIYLAGEPCIAPVGTTFEINGHSYTVTPDGLERVKEKRRVTLHVGMTKGGNVLVSEAGPYTAEHGYSACSRVTLVEGEFEG